MITNVCNEAPLGFMVIGDCNIAMSAAETSSANPDSASMRNLPFYSNFLMQLRAIDVWSAQPDQAWQTHWTFKSFADNPSHCAILDQIAYSEAGILTTYIDVLKDFISGTDH